MLLRVSTDPEWPEMAWKSQTYLYGIPCRYAVRYFWFRLTVFVRVCSASLHTKNEKLLFTLE